MMYTLYTPECQEILVNISLLEKVKRFVMVLSEGGVDMMVDYSGSLSKSLVTLSRDPQDNNQIIHYRHPQEALEVRLDFPHFWSNMHVVMPGEYMTISLGVSSSRLYINQVVLSPDQNEEILALQHQVLQEKQLGTVVPLASVPPGLRDQEYYLVDIEVTKQEQELDSLFRFIKLFSQGEYNFSEHFEIEYNTNVTRGKYLKVIKTLEDNT